MAVKKEVESTELALKDQAGVPADYSGFEEYAGQGLDDISSEDKGLPFLEILQGQSPELDDVPGARPGMIINKSTKELFDADKGVRFVPACREHVYTEWVPRDSGGGLMATYQITDPVVTAARAKQRVGKFLLPNGNELIETFYLFGAILDEDDTPTPAVISFTSTKIGPYKTLTTRSDSLMFKAKDGRKLKFPWFAHVWRLTVKKEKKDTYAWYNWVVAFDGKNDKAEEARLPANHPVIELCAGIVTSQREGQLKLNSENVRREDSASTGSGSSYGGVSNRGSSAGEDEPPF